MRLIINLKFQFKRCNILIQNKKKIKFNYQNNNLILIISMTSLYYQETNQEYEQNNQEFNPYRYKKLHSLAFSDQQSFYRMNSNASRLISRNSSRKTSQDDSNFSCLQKNSEASTTCPEILKIQGMNLKVYFYELKQCKEFEIGQFGITTSVKEFIQYAINSFLYQSYNFIPEVIDLASFELKLLNEKKQNKIMNHHEIAQYFCENLLIQKKQILNSNLERFQNLCPQEIVVEIHLPFPKSRFIMNLNKNMKFSELKSIVMKKFNFKNSKEFIFVTYFNMQLIDEQLEINQISQRRFQFLKIRKIDFQSYIKEKQQKKILEKKKKQLEQNNKLSKNSNPKIQTEISQCALVGKMKLSIEGDYIIEKYEQGPLFKVMSLFYPTYTEKKFQVKDLKAVYLQENFLVLKFENITKKYKMAEVHQKQFLHEILRQFRILKKTLNLLY